MSINVKFKRLRTYAQVPTKSTKGAACYDATLADTHPPLSPGEIRVIPLGFSVEIPDGFELQIRARSGLSTRGIIVANSVGCIDSDYRGEVGVILMNVGGGIQPLNQGDRVCQLKISRADNINFEVVDELDCTERQGGFGSTGGVSDAE